MPESKYNATVVGKILLRPDIMTLRVDTDEPREEFSAGQYTLLGLFGREGRTPDSTIEADPAEPDKLIQRPYSIASATRQRSQLEFFISLVKSGQLTPRLFNLSPGDRLFVSKRIVGVFKLAETPPNKDIVMVATGTGMAPYMSFLRSYLTERPESKIAMIQGATKQWDLGYYSELNFLANMFDNFIYLPTLTEADPTWNGHQMWIEEMLEADVLEKEAGIVIDPQKTHFFLSGNPKMVASVSNWLMDRNYSKHSRKKPGALHVEEFWT